MAHAGQHSKARPDWIIPVALGLVVVAGALLRWWQIGAESLWLDEGASWYFSRMPVWTLLTQRVDPGNPPLYYLMVAGWMRLFGESEAALRGLSALAGVLSVPWLYLLGRELFGRRAGLVAAVLLAFCPAHVYYSQEARAYSMVLLFGLVSAWMLVRATRTDRLAHWAGATLFAALAFYAHFSGLLLPAFQAAWLLRARPSRRALLAAAVFTALALPGVVRFLAPGVLTPGGYPYWQGRVTLGELAQALNTLFGRPALGADPAAAQAAVGILLLLVAALPLWQGVRDALKPEADHAPAVWFALCYFLVPFVLFAAAARVKPVWQDKYLLVALPGYLLLVAWALVQMRGAARLALAGALAAVTVVGFARWMTPAAPPLTAWGRRPGPFAAHPNWYPWMAKQDWRSAAAVLRHVEAANPGDTALVLVLGYIHWGLDYYYRGSWPTIEFPERRHPLTTDDEAALNTLTARAAALPSVVVLLADRDDADPDLLLVRRLVRQRGAGRFRRCLGLRVFAFGPAARSMGGQPVTIASLEGEGDPRP